MPIDSHLIHRCDVARATEAEDEYNETVRVFAPHLSSVACRLVEKQEREAPSEMAEGALITIYLLLLPAGTDITEDDQISSITFEDGTTDEHVYTVESIATRRARTARHVSAQLERVR